jgi:hypothetical protein
MVGFFAYANSLDIYVDKKELEGTFYKLILPTILFTLIFVVVLVGIY